jgi:hypothetical protein
MVLPATRKNTTVSSAAFEAMPKIMLLSHASEENITKHWVNTTTLHADPKHSRHASAKGSRRMAGADGS